MGVESLTQDNYIPDFSAKIVGKAMLLRITRKDYREALSHVSNTMAKLNWKSRIKIIINININ